VALPDCCLMSEPDDVELMRLAGGGDEQAFEQLVERHQNLVIGTVAKMLGGAEGAEDIAQQVFVRVWQSAPRYRPEAKFTTWLLTIVRNLVFNETRRRRRGFFQPFENDDGSVPDIRDLSMRDASAELGERELREAIDAAIAALPEAQRMAIILRRFEDMPYEDIAEVLKTSVPAVKSLLFRAREDLRVRLKGFLAEG
jgi:RNA polymerase sigma-70 factor (ECF subfamily)